MFCITYLIIGMNVSQNQIEQQSIRNSLYTIDWSIDEKIQLRFDFDMPGERKELSKLKNIEGLQ